MKIDKSQFIKDICTSINSDNIDSNEMKNLLSEVIQDDGNNLDILYRKYRQLLGYNNILDDDYWIKKYSTKKGLSKSLRQFKSHKLDEIDTAKLLSSLITHALIELKYNKSVTKSDTGVDELLILLNKIALSNYSNDYYDEVYRVLTKYKIIK